MLPDASGQAEHAPMVLMPAMRSKPSLMIHRRVVFATPPPPHLHHLPRAAPSSLIWDRPGRVDLFLEAHLIKIWWTPLESLFCVFICNGSYRQILCYLLSGPRFWVLEFCTVNVIPKIVYSWDLKWIYPQNTRHRCFDPPNAYECDDVTRPTTVTLF